jgi:hypothetical protein
VALTFHRELGPGEQVELVNLMREIEGVHLSPTPDVISWSSEPSGKFPGQSLYRKVCGDAKKALYGPLEDSYTAKI